MELILEYLGRAMDKKASDVFIVFRYAGVVQDRR